MTHKPVMPLRCLLVCLPVGLALWAVAYAIWRALC